jgi:hypothetical protein
MLSMLVTGTTTLSSPWLITCTPVSVDINGFYPETWALEGAGHLLTQLAALVLVIHIFLLPPALFVEKTQTPCI